MNSTTILVIDDEPQLRRAMKATLSSIGYTVVEAKSGEEALAQVDDLRPDLVLLDLNMPGLGGLETCRALRDRSDIPIIILSVRSAEPDKVQALDAGADDYVTKPFGIQELLARIRAAMRRSPATATDVKCIRIGDLEIDFVHRRVTSRSRPVRLTPKEFELLQFLANNANRPVPHRKLLQAVWGPDYGDEVEYLRVFINSLRKKIEATPSKPEIVVTEPWVGYRFVLADSTDANS
jgi:two-component system KDP operon response regulator KdpE